MTYMTNKTYGGYRKLKSFQMATIVYDLTVEFCKLYMTYTSNMSYRTNDQMIQAARSGRQNIAEGSKASGTSRKTEIKLVGVTRASLEELLLDLEDFLRQRGLKLWGKDAPRAREIRQLVYKSNTSYSTYRSYLANPESAANCLICLIHQANYLLDRQLEAIKKEFVENGGFSESLLRERLERRNAK